MSGTHGAGCKIHTAGRLMSHFQALTLAGEQDGVIPNDIASSNRSKADGLAVPLAGMAFSPVNGALAQIPSQFASQYFTVSQCCARGGIHLVAMMGFDDLYIHRITQDARSQLHQFERQIDSNAEVGCGGDGNITSCLL